MDNEPATAPEAVEPWNILPIRALLLTAPKPDEVHRFCKFIRETLPEEDVNTLVMRIRYQYQFESHPELADADALSKADLSAIAAACRDAGVALVPKMNLLGHQSEKSRILPLLAKYPQFDESPHLAPPDPFVYDSHLDFYCKSLCPQHPDLFPILFPLMDELIDACGAEMFHVGLDEVFIIADPQCPRCGGCDPAELFAGIARTLRDHLAEKGCRTWIWSDRLLDGKTTNLLAWQASLNNTHRAVDMLPKDILICDWKYEDAPPTPAYFAIKGYDVVACPWNRADVALAQLEQVYSARRNAARSYFSAPLASRFRGMFATSWGGSRNFIDAYHDPKNASGALTEMARGEADSFRQLFAEIRRNRDLRKPA